MILNDIPQSERVEWHLRNWQTWMHRPALRLGMPRKAAVGENYTSVDLDNEIAYESLDDDLAERTNAVIDGLVPAQRMAIYKAYGMISVWRFPRDNFEAVLKLAKASVAVGLVRKGVWLGD